MPAKRMSLRATMSLVVFLAILVTALLLYVPWFLVGQRDIRKLTHIANTTVLHDLTLRLRYLLEDTEGVFDILRYDIEHPEIDLSEHHELFLFALLSNDSFHEIGYIGADQDYRLLRRLDAPGTFAFARFRPDPATPLLRVPADILALPQGSGTPVPPARKSLAVTNPLRADWYLDPRHGAGGVVWTDFQADRDSNILKTTYARRFTDAQGRHMTAYIRIHLDPPEDAILSLRSGVDLNLFLLDRTGNLLAHAARTPSAGLDGAPDANGGIPDNRLAMIQGWIDGHADEFALMSQPLHGEIRDPVTREPYSISLHPVPDMEWIIGTILPADVLARHVVRHFHLQAWLLPLLSLGALILTMVGVRRFLGRPLQALCLRIDRLQDLDFSGASRTEETDFAIEELHDMNEAVNRMDTALRSFRTYIPADLIRQQMRTGQAARLGCSPRTLTILRTRIADWDTLLATENSDPILRRYPEYLEAITTAILNHGGTIDAFVDGTLHAFFGAPIPLRDPERRACRAVLRAQARLRTLNDAWIAEGLPPLHTHFALHTGETLVGNIGTPARMSYSAIGPAVRMTGMISRHHDRYGAEILLSASTCHATGDTFRTRPLDRLPLQGEGEAVELFELLGEREDGDALSEEEERVRPYRMGYRAYWDGDYVQAMTYLQAFLHVCPGDTAARLYLHRCEEKQKQATGPNWTALTSPLPGNAAPGEA